MISSIVIRHPFELKLVLISIRLLDSKLKREECSTSYFISLCSYTRPLLNGFAMNVLVLVFAIYSMIDIKNKIHIIQHTRQIYRLTQTNLKSHQIMIRKIYGKKKVEKKKEKITIGPKHKYKRLK